MVEARSPLHAESVPPIRVRTPVAEAPGVMGEHVLPAPVVKCVEPAAPAPVAEIVAPAPVVTCTAPTPAVDSPPAVTNAASVCSRRVCSSSACRRIRCSQAPAATCAAPAHVDAVRARATEHVAQIASRRARRHAYGDPQRLPPLRAEASRCPTAGTQRLYLSGGLGTFSTRTLAGRGARYLLNPCAFSARDQEGQEGQAQALMWTVHELATACPGTVCKFWASAARSAAFLCYLRATRLP